MIWRSVHDQRPRVNMATVLLVAVASAIGMVVGPAQADPTAPAFGLSASTAAVGYVALHVSGASAVGPISLSELVTGSSTPLPLATVDGSGGAAVLPRAARWRCDRTTRTFQATQVVAGATVSATTTVSTPSCAGRLEVSVTSTRLHRDHPLTVRLSDRWGLGGLRVGACVSEVGPRPCPSVTLPRGHRSVSVRFRLGESSRPLLEVYDAYQIVRLRPRVSPGEPVLLATGDSEMQILDDDLSSDLGGPAGADVIGDARESTAISTPFVFDWPAHAVSQVDDDHPDIVAMFLGGNEGFSLAGVNCCGSDWAAQYAVKVEGMMREYLQRGAANVYWFLIPTPSKPQFVRVVNAVNAGILTAASHFREGVHVFDLRPLFSPGGHYIDSLTYAGRTITVHEADGFHLSASADEIVAGLFLSRLRDDGLIS